MKKITKYILSASLGISALAMSSCEKDFLDINTDPNNPTDVPVAQLLPAVELSVADATSIASGTSSSTAYMMHHLVTRGDLNDYIMVPAAFTPNSVWNGLFLDALTDINVIIEKGTADGDLHYVGIAKILKGYIYSILVDYYGSIPFETANLGAENASPQFTGGAVIYNEVFALIDAGIADLAATSVLSPGNDDLFYGGNRASWRKFAKTLKLKLYNQIRLVEDVSAEVNALLQEGDLISSPAEDFQIQYGTSQAPDDRNPTYASEYAPGTHSYISPYFYEVMTNQNTFGHNGNLFPTADPRVPYYFYNQINVAAGEEPENPTAYFNNATGFLSIYQFSFNIDPNEGFDQASSQTVVGLYPCGGRFDAGDGATANFNGVGNTPHRILTYFDRLYIEAELINAGVVAGDEAATTEAAIRASFAKVNEVAADAGAPAINAAAIDNYVTNVMGVFNAGNTSERLQVIMTQKWIASFGNASDIYNDWRRTGYPILHDGNTDNLAVTVRSRDFIQSFPYPQRELDLNSNAPAQKNIYSAKVFWDN